MSKKVSKNTEIELNKILKSSEKDHSYSNYIGIYNQVKSIKINESKIPEKKKIKIAFLSSFTVNHITFYMDVCCRKIGLFPKIYICPYGNYYQDILNKKSALYSFLPDMIFILLDTETIIPDFNNLIFDLKPAQRKREIEKIVSQFAFLANELCKNSKSLVLIHNFSRPYYSPLGILDTKTPLGLSEFINEINNRLNKRFRKNNQVFIIDYDLITSDFGKKNCIEENMRFLAQMRVSQNIVPELCNYYMGYIKAFKGINKKCVVLDLDNTLWGGIIGEDSFETIKLGPNPPGNIYLELQKVLFGLFKRGIILAINSRNNYEESIKVIREHPHMILREEHFASIKINWNDKVSNMKEIANEINIGLNSICFIDDDPANREMMRSCLPEVLTVELPENPALFPGTIRQMNDFETLQFTEEDKRRGELYAEERKRVEFKKSVQNLEDYLQNLCMKINIKKANSFTIPRIAQLVQRTNQFNLTTKRYNELEIIQFTKSPVFSVFSLELSDKFGNSGVVGVMILKKGKNVYTIDTFLLSCRVIGRGLEHAFLSYIVNESKKQRISRLVGEYIPTSRNSIVKDLYSTFGFKKIKENKRKTVFEYNCKIQKIEFPKWLEFK